MKSQQVLAQVFKSCDAADFNTVQQLLNLHNERFKPCVDYYTAWAYFCKCQDKVEEMAQYLEKILEIEPNHTPSILSLASVMSHKKDYDRTIELMGAIIEQKTVHQKVKPDYFRLYAYALFQTNQYERAIPFYQQYFELDNGIPSSWINAGICYDKLNQSDLAKKITMKGLKLYPEHHELWYSLGNILLNNAQPEQAKDAYQKSLDYGGDKNKAYNGIACAFIYLGNHHGAVEYFDKSLATSSNTQSKELTRWNRSHLLLANEQWDEGWQEYEYRWQLDSFKNWNIPWNIPKWHHGFSVKSKAQRQQIHVLVHGEQGIGDQILFARFADILAQQNNLHITMSVEPRLETLMRRSLKSHILQGGWQHEHLKQNEIGADAWLSMASLPLACGFKGDYNNPLPAYLHGDDSIGEILIKPARLQANNRPLIGVSWRSFARDPALALRNMDVLNLIALTKKTNAMLVNLQYGPAMEDWDILQKHIPEHLITLNHFDPRQSIDRIAALISKLDGVVTIANATCHIAGALGVPTALLTSTGPRWIWGTHHTNSCWYESVKIFRQKTLKDWGHPLTQAIEWLNHSILTKP